MLTGKFSSSYRKPGGRLMYIYFVNGTAKEIEAFKSAQGTNLRTDDKGNILFFVSATLPNGGMRLLKPTINITISGGENPRAVLDESNQQFAFMAKVEDHLALATAQEMAKLLVNPIQSTVPAVAQPAPQQTTP